MQHNKIKFDGLELSDHTYSRKYDGVRYVYDVPNLLQFAKDKGYKTFDLPLAGIDMSSLMWRILNMRDIACHIDRVNKADFKHPILIDNQGCICDGWHRVMKAIMLGHTTIKAIRLMDMPFASSTEDLD